MRWPPRRRGCAPGRRGRPGRERRLRRRGGRRPARCARSRRRRGGRAARRGRRACRRPGRSSRSRRGRGPAPGLPAAFSTSPQSGWRIPTPRRPRPRGTRLQREPERARVPVAAALDVGDGKREMVQARRHPACPVVLHDDAGVHDPPRVLGDEAAVRFGVDVAPGGGEVGEVEDGDELVVAREPRGVVAVAQSVSSGISRRDPSPHGSPRGRRRWYPAPSGARRPDGTRPTPSLIYRASNQDVYGRV